MISNEEILIGEDGIISIETPSSYSPKEKRQDSYEALEALMPGISSLADSFMFPAKHK